MYADVCRNTLIMHRLKSVGSAYALTTLSDCKYYTGKLCICSRARRNNLLITCACRLILKKMNTVSDLV